MRAPLLGVVTLISATHACSADRREQVTPSLPTRVPLESRAEPRPPRAAEPPEAREPSSLLSFTPLLAEPELSLAAEALDAGDVSRAALEVEAALGRHPPDPTLIQSHQLLLARLREAAGDLRGAAASYDLAAAAPGQLSGYGALGAGRTLLRAGLVEDARTRLEAVPEGGPLGAEALRVLAEAQLGTSGPEAAVASLRRYLRDNGAAPEATEASLRLAELLVAGDAKKPGTPEARALAGREAVGLARRVLARAPSDAALASRADAALAAALLLLPEPERRERAHADPAEELERLRALVDARQFEPARRAADGILLSLGEKARTTDIGCEAELLRARSLGGLREWGKGADEADDVGRRCKDPDVRARALFLAGKYADADKRFPLALRSYETLEHDLPGHKLADDARLRAALTYFEMGAEGRFTELLSRMPDDYPEGDMVLDGMFALAIHRVEKGDWASATAVLERAAGLARRVDGKRGQEFSGRERYFQARAWGAIGEIARSLAEYEAIVRELPLSYYMLHAYSRLAEADGGRAARALDETVREAATATFSLERRPELGVPAFLRALELLRVGDVERGRRELDALGVIRADAAPAVLWAIALVYGRAGAPKLSNDVARGLLTDWLVRWPSGDWARAWEIAFPRPYHELVAREAKKNGVPEHLVYAIMREESSFDPDAESPAKAYGLMQLIVPTARHFGKPLGLVPDAEQLKRPAVNIGIGCRVLAELTRSFSENPLLAVPGYNAGAGKPRRWLGDRPSVDFDVWVELIPYLETRRYTKRVLASRAAYAFLYARPEADSVLRLPIKLAVR